MNTECQGSIPMLSSDISDLFGAFEGRETARFSSSAPAGALLLELLGPDLRLRPTGDHRATEGVGFVAS